MDLMAAPGSAARTLLARPVSVESDGAPRVPPFSAIYRDYFDFVWSSARRLGAGLDAIDDLVQEIFVVIHRRLGTLEHPAALRSWIYGIVRRKVSTYRRSQRTREGSGSALALECQTRELTPFDVAEQREQVKLLSKLLDKLDSAKREVFVLVELEEVTAPEIACLLGVPVSTIYSRLRAARQAFNEALARHNAQGEGRPCCT
jgi:RNA polymerase sigma-70 factor (ECF subfamily)